MTVYDRELLDGVKSRARRCYDAAAWEGGLLRDIEQVCDQLAATMPPPRWVVSYEVEAETPQEAREAQVPPWTVRSARPR